MFQLRHVSKTILWCVRKNVCNLVFFSITDPSKNDRGITFSSFFRSLTRYQSHVRQNWIYEDFVHD